MFCQYIIYFYINYNYKQPNYFGNYFCASYANKKIVLIGNEFIFQNSTSKACQNPPF